MCIEDMIHQDEFKTHEDALKELTNQIQMQKKFFVDFFNDPIRFVS